MANKIKHNGIYLLPNILTTASLFAAFYSIVSSMKGHFASAAIAIYYSVIADTLDGRIARVTNTQTDFGAEYDSLADIVAFGLAPSLLAYVFQLQTYGKIGWLICFAYTAATALRLARFNTQLEVTDKSYFQGLPCPSAAAMLAAFIWLGHQFHLRNSLFTFGCALLMVLGSMFMVSNIRYYSFKEIDFKGKVPFLYLLFLVILFVLVAAYPACILFITFTTYAFSGPIQTLIQKHRMRLKRKKGPNRRKPFKP
ncbi:MAG: CDP-diacylglycerol--serine O-phosphatidyltransferase [Legionellales bacterium RIFCSPHIGHO2_12_FULL_37_14]|nr:MAG: CDP-diacylglycerol--serine O-phosphatidyltransferase [Legionellales bacterium RIFCSPHIGHO2_12_FULL_37_14]